MNKLILSILLILLVSPYIYSNAVDEIASSVAIIKVSREGESDLIGTGFVVRNDGWIITAAHVVKDKKFIRARFPEGEDDVGTVSYTEPKYDLALLKLAHPKKLKSLVFSDRRPELRDKIWLIGHPFQYEWSISEGIISGKSRKIKMPNDIYIDDLLQISTNINPGNSGGPLFDSDDKVIGMITAYRNGAQGIGFAISGYMIKEFIKDKLEKKVEFSSKSQY